jgi:small nuclear ribonucleoprotein (snRNP)-like protein
MGDDGATPVAHDAGTGEAIPRGESATPDARPTVDLGGPDVLATLARWSAEARVDHAARARARESWMRRQQIEETTFAGVLADLAERDRPVLLHTVSGRRVRGVLRAHGADFVALRTESAQVVLVRHHAIVAVRTQPHEPAALSGRSVSVTLSFFESLVALADDRPRVLIVTTGNETFAGDLHSVGVDVVTVRNDGQPATTFYVPLDAVLEVSFV